MVTYESLWFSVRARALGSFLDLGYDSGHRLSSNQAHVPLGALGRPLCSLYHAERGFSFITSTYQFPVMMVPV